MAPKTPYRFQMYMPEPMRLALREVAHIEKKSMNEIVYDWLLERLRAYPQVREILADDADEALLVLTGTGP